MRTLGDRVLIRPVARATETPSGLALIHSDPVCSGTILAMGNGTLCPMCDVPLVHEVQVGDTVLFSPFAPGQEFHLNGETLFILHASDMLAVLE